MERDHVAVIIQFLAMRRCTPCELLHVLAHRLIVFFDVGRTDVLWVWIAGRSGFRKMGYTHGKIIKTVRSADLSRQIDIVARNDGTFQFFEQIAHSEKDGGGWLPGKVSGIYGSAETAEIAVRSEFKL
jgi:hypothetical protein